MKESGYSSKERFEAIRGGVMRVEQMKRVRDNGDIASLNREKNEIIQKKPIKEEKLLLHGI